jgi:hypothetical protein
MAWIIAVLGFGEVLSRLRRPRSTSPPAPSPPHTGLLTPASRRRGGEEFKETGAFGPRLLERISPIPRTVSCMSNFVTAGGGVWGLPSE